MKSSYKPLGNYIRQVKLRNSDLNLTEPMGINISKFFMPSVANTIGTDLSRYRVVKNGQFAYNPMHVGRDEVLPIALLKGKTNVIISPAYIVFEIIDKKVLNPEYLMMWFRRKDFDREAWFTTDNSVRGGFSWESLCVMKLPIPSPEKQQQIIKEYNTVVNRIALNEEINEKLEENAQTLYKHWFVNFEFPITKEYAEAIGKPQLEGKPYKSSGGEMVYSEDLEQEIPKEFKTGFLSDIANIKMGQSPPGASYNKSGQGAIFFQGRTEFGFRFPSIKSWTTQPKRMAKKGDILMSVRAPVGDVNIASQDCCIGRGLAALHSIGDYNNYLFHLMTNIRQKFDTANSEGTIYGSINKDNLKGLEIIIVPTTLVKVFDVMAQKIDYPVEIISKELNLLGIFNNIILAKMARVEVTYDEVH